MLQNCNLLEGECAIFDDVIPLIIKSVKIVASKIKDSSSSAKKSVFAIVAVIAIVLSLSFTGTRIAYKVNYGGNIIATVGHKNQFDEALKLVVNMVGDNEVEKTVSKPSFSTAIVLNENINNTQEVANAIIDNTDEIVEATTLYVNGSAVATAEKAFIEKITQERLNSFNIEGQECNNRFADEVITQDGYYMVCDLDNKANAEKVVSELAVITELRQTTDVVVPYTSTVETTDQQVVGYKKVTVSGVSGLSRVTQDVVMINGVVQSSVTVDTKVVVAPVNEVVVKGTAPSKQSAQQVKEAASAGFIFPLPAGSWRVGAYYGDGRGHKGVDLCASGGTSIFAAAEGRVVHAGWKGDFGYCVIIEHPNGLRTLYAHARQVCCSVGDTVSQGEIIALVGTTGQSTGNHLHFEVISGGRRVNPAPYINLK